MIAILLYKTVAHAHVVVVLHADLGNVAALDLAMLQLSRDFVDECVTASASGANVDSYLCGRKCTAPCILRPVPLNPAEHTVPLRSSACSSWTV